MTTANLNRLHLLMIGMPMTEQIIQLLDQIDVLAQQSTQGPWEVSGRTIESDHVDSPYYLDVVSTEVNCMEFCHGGSGYGVDKTSDAEFIALSRTAMPMLAAAVRAAIELCDELDSTARDLTMLRPMTAQSKAEGIAETVQSVRDAFSKTIGATIESA